MGQPTAFVGLPMAVISEPTAAGLDDFFSEIVGPGPPQITKNPRAH